MELQQKEALRQRLLLVARISELFKVRGWDLVAVGQFALEYFTEGEYASDEVDVCRGFGQKQQFLPQLRLKQ
jgi:hypothetical protein